MSGRRRQSAQSQLLHNRRRAFPIGWTPDQNLARRQKDWYAVPPMLGDLPAWRFSWDSVPQGAVSRRPKHYIGSSFQLTGKGGDLTQARNRVERFN